MFYLFFFNFGCSKIKCFLFNPLGEPLDLLIFTEDLHLVERTVFRVTNELTTKGLAAKHHFKDANDRLNGEEEYFNRRKKNFCSFPSHLMSVPY